MFTGGGAVPAAADPTIGGRRYEDAVTRLGTETVRLLDELAANATAATIVQLVDGWQLRAAPERPFRRCNSVLPFGG